MSFAAIADKDEENCEEERIPAPSHSTDSEYDPEKKARHAKTSFKPILFYQELLNDIVSGLALSQQMTELLASRLQETACFRNRWWLTHYRKLSMNLSAVFRMDRPLSYSLLKKLVEKRIAFPHCLYILICSNSTL